MNAAKQLVELDVAQGQVEVTVQHAAWGIQADAGFELAAGQIDTCRVNPYVPVLERDLCLHMLERQLHRLNGIAREGDPRIKRVQLGNIELLVWQDGRLCRCLLCRLLLLLC